MMYPSFTPNLTHALLQALLTLAQPSRRWLATLRRLHPAWLVLPCLWAWAGAQADMIIDTTRVIYPEARRELTFRITNVSKDKPAFVQMWLDDGNAASSPEDSVTPFNLSPPVARLRADGAQVVRLVYTGEPLPVDRESVFYFNMLEVPQKSAEENKLVFAVRTRIKVFFRPKALRGDPNQMMNQASWKITQKDGNWVAEGTNPTPYHMSFFNVSLGQGGTFSSTFDGGMLPPLGKGTVVLGEVDKFVPAFNKIKVEFVSDYGGPIPVEFALNPGP